VLIRLHRFGFDVLGLLLLVGLYRLGFAFLWSQAECQQLIFKTVTHDASNLLINASIGSTQMQGCEAWPEAIQTSTGYSNRAGKTPATPSSESACQRTGTLLNRIIPAALLPAIPLQI
jgi:hypothetical protein